MNKIIKGLLVMGFIIIAVAFLDSWIRFMAEYEEVIGMEEELRMYGPMK